jgi:UDP-GlcNAc:undecaprenyl-phosphate GlcNAc-1-phosphate transferase
MVLFTTLLFSLFSTMALIPILKRKAERLNCMDTPDKRKIHSRPIPKVGGLSMAAGVLVPLLMWNYGDRLGMSLLIGACIIVIFGFVDDTLNLPWYLKLSVQLAAALVVVLMGDVKIGFIDALTPSGSPSDWTVSIITVIVIVGVTNAVNLADGLDGLAGGLMLVSFTFMGFLGYIGGNQLVTLISVAVTGAILGFLPYNTHPATVFMGDTGSQLLGFLAGTMSLIVPQANHDISPVLPLFIIGLPVIDTLMVVFERLSKGRLPFHADTNHIHHKLLRMNFFHGEAVMVLFSLQCGFITIGFFMRFHSELFQLSSYAAFATAIAAFFILADRKALRRHRPGALDRLLQ